MAVSGDVKASVSSILYSLVIRERVHLTIVKQSTLTKCFEKKYFKERFLWFNGLLTVAAKVNKYFKKRFLVFKGAGLTKN